MTALTEKPQSGAEGIREALDIALEKDSSVFLIGEGVADPKGIFGTTTGLIGKYGPQRVVETPIAENGFTGVAIGAAMMGQRPVVIHQRSSSRCWRWNRSSITQRRRTMFRMALTTCQW